MNEEKIVMYDSAEAAERKTVTGWVSGELGGTVRFWGEDEHMARYCGSTHKKCDCGTVIKISQIQCDSCYNKRKMEEILKMPFQDWDGSDAVYYDAADKYFFNEDDLIEFMSENGMTEINLLICRENHYQTVDADFWEGDAPEDWEPPAELEKAMEELNKVIQNLPPISYSPDKIRTSYKLKK